ncbi:hypothetical protein B7463_g3412, partial [Scytalidium lignicola]
MTFTNTQLIYARTPAPTIIPDLSNGTFTLKTEQISETIPDDKVIVRVHHLSLDPAMRHWLTAQRSYIEPVQLGEVMRCQASAQIIAVGRGLKDRFKKGDWIIAMTGCQEYALLTAEEIQFRNAILPGSRPSDSLSILGDTLLTAYFGIIEVSKVKRGDTVVISGAAGATGIMAGQIAKLKGAKVIGIAGSQEKCEFLVNELGLDAAINYKDQDWAEKLKAAVLPGYIDVYFDNVGGEVLDNCLRLAARNSRFTICGNISQYNAEKPRGPSNIIQTQRITMKGFIVFDYIPQFSKALEELRQWLQEGRIQRKEYIISGGLKAVPQGLVGLFAGVNTGKMMVEVASQSEAI